MATDDSPLRSDILSARHDDQARIIKRRDLRKGTHSCWECKRRKMRCVLSDTSSNTQKSVCQGCRRRGTACISQEVPEEVAFGIINDTRESGYAANTFHEPPLSINRTSHDPLTPASTISRPSQLSPVNASEGEHGSLSQHLYAALPSLEDTKTIYRARPPFDVPAHALMTMPYTTLFQSDMADAPESSIDPVSPVSHPVLIARHMLMLASSLQHLDPAVQPEIRGLSEVPQAMADRLTRLVNTYVTSRDEMLGSIEALECVLIESVYQANLGNLRRSWMLARRAVSIAQLMGLDQANRRTSYQVLDQRRRHDPQVIWRRIVFLDRFLCLMLSLPASCPDSASLQSPEDSTMGQRLERIHCMVASRILEANGKDQTMLDRGTLQVLDAELQRAARSLPVKWWRIPRLDASQADPRAIYWNTGRMFAQVLHYNLIYRLHLPYMFRGSPTDRTHEYSRITCVNASREILTRFLALRGFNSIATSCRLTDLIALMAALTLLLTYLHSQATATESFLAHQYHSDRAMIEQVQESMETLDQLKSDPMSASSADLLRRLMAIDIYEGDSLPRPVNRVDVHPGGSTDAAEHEDEHSISIRIPYFGLVTIARDANFNLSFRHSDMHLSSPLRSDDTRYPAIADRMNTPGRQRSAAMSSFDDTQNHGALSGTVAGLMNAVELPISHSTSDLALDRSAQQESYPSLVAGMDEWAHQGVDLAFFDTILQSIEDNGHSYLGS